MPPTADLLNHRDRTAHGERAAATTAQPARRRRRRSEPNLPLAAAALQRALDRRDNGGATGH